MQYQETLAGLVAVAVLQPRPAVLELLDKGRTAGKELVPSAAAVAEVQVLKGALVC
jgi:hypothetical protein